MHYRLYLAFVVLAVLGCSHQKAETPESGVVATSNTTGTEQRSEPFAVLELFSSEGCSDCPSAEAWLNELALEAVADKNYIYPMAFHVDYWNHLGWRDVFSDSTYSNRQRTYRKALGNEVVYTPQMVVNGTVDFTGSDRIRTKAEIASALSKTPDLYFNIHPNEDWTELRYEVVNAQGEVATAPEAFLFEVAIVERGLKTKVQRGENAGRFLEHENVVQHFQRYAYAPEGGTVKIDYPIEHLDKDFSIIAMVQHRHSMHIAGANRWNY